MKNWIKTYGWIVVDVLLLIYIGVSVVSLWKEGAFVWLFSLL